VKSKGAGFAAGRLLHTAYRLRSQAAISSDTDICENEWNQPSALELI
jgi:hypothetical protein